MSQRKNRVPLVMDKRCLVSEGLGACKNSGSASLSSVSLDGVPERGFLQEGRGSGG